MIDTEIRKISEIDSDSDSLLGLMEGKKKTTPPTTERSYVDNTQLNNMKNDAMAYGAQHYSTLIDIRIKLMLFGIILFLMTLSIRSLTRSPTGALMRKRIMRAM